MLDERVIELAKYRIEQAENCVQVSETLLNDEFLRDSLNRSYYGIFHCMRAVLALDKYDSKKHSGIIDEFRKRYIKTELFDVRFSKIIGSAFKERNRSDYEDFYIASKVDTALQLEQAKELLSATKDYIKKQIEVKHE